MGLEESEDALYGREVPYATMTNSDPRKNQESRPWTHLRRNILSSPNVETGGETVDPVCNWVSSDIDPSDIEDEVERFGKFAIYASSPAYGNMDNELKRYFGENEDVVLYNPPQINSIGDELMAELEGDVPVTSDAKNVSEGVGVSSSQAENFYDVSIIGDQPVHAVKWLEEDIDGTLMGKALGIYGKMPKAMMQGNAKHIDFHDTEKNHSDLLAFSYDAVDSILEEANANEDSLIIGAKVAEIDSGQFNELQKAKLSDQQVDNGNFYVLSGLGYDPGSAPDLMSFWKGRERPQSSEAFLRSAAKLTDSKLSEELLKDLDDRLNFFFPKLTEEDPAYLDRAEDLAN